jgi:hypothetical protein
VRIFGRARRRRQRSIVIFSGVDHCFVKIKSISRVKITALRRRAFPSISEIPQGDPLNIGLVQIQRGEPLI